MKKLLTGLAAGALALTVLSSSAFAEVSFDSANGTGFVGKGDVQTVLGWNNAELQKNAANLKFTYESTDTYEITVEWTTGEGTKGEKTHSVEHKRTNEISSGVEYDPRKAKQVNGFILKEMSNSTETLTDLPEVGDIFPGKSGHTVVNVEKVSSTNTLYVNGVALQ
jgi:hypothetical protein